MIFIIYSGHFGVQCYVNLKFEKFEKFVILFYFD